ncbi:proline racemase [Streptomyces pluripotens]|uniref:Proline racemase n=1 Tax=Streptomyces pluripotens TaxID=1355015 RepID=A0A221NTN5_9ACTN|nr:MULTISPECIES: proline racemase family protein [Streptomyces]ARP68948.1 proline racemase [Streptomyces pluripotens]ASN23206.1 proline racemase [Streptomyces pluripotens]KIE25793.1 proline racemase [Streptomyces sp. MUSC 125]MCH0556941.1 proline racemase family protein [Streptomyces sp. MUM 16J]
MRSTLVLHAVDSHTEGMPTRVITGGIGTVPGATMNERRLYFREHLDHIRRLLVNEPRGHSAMSGAVLQAPSRPDCDWGVIYIEVSGCLPMCGHGTIGVATVLVETGMVEVMEPVTTIRLDTPAGVVVAEVAVENGAAASVTLRNVPSFAVALNRAITLLDGRTVSYDLAYGGNFYAILPLDAFDLPFDRSRKDDILTAGLSLMDAINAQAEPVHPEDPHIRGCHHVHLYAPGATGRRSRHAMVIHPGWFDRSPCGTGTSARMAQLHARGELPLHTEFVNESFIGTQFTGRLLGETEVAGRPAVLPSFTGRAWITGTAQYLLDPTDPFPEGFVL